MRLLLPLLFLPLAAMTCNPGDGPEPDACFDPEDGDVDGLAVGARNASGFLRLVDNARVPLVYGSQGGQMVGVRLRLTGDNPPRCVDQTATLRDADGDVLARLSVPVNTYQDSDSTTRTTQPIWLVLDGRVPDYGELVELEIETPVGTVQRTLELALDQPQVMAPMGIVTIAGNGGTGVVMLELEEPAPPSGVDVLIEELGSTTGSATPRSLTIPEGLTSYGFRVSSELDGGYGELLVSDSTGALTVFIETGDPIEISPSTTELIINEVYSGSQDVNCDGAVDAGDDFIEIHNRGTFAISLDNLQLHQGSTLHWFGPTVLGPRETLLVSRKPMTTCTETGTQGEVVPALDIVSSQLLSIQTAWGILDSVIPATVASGQSAVRFPEFSGSFTAHGEASAGALPASPGLRTSGHLFAEDALP